jgi:hypothetical protein
MKKEFVVNQRIDAVRKALSEAQAEFGRLAATLGRDLSDAEKDLFAKLSAAAQATRNELNQPVPRVPAPMPAPVPVTSGQAASKQ